MLIGNQHFGTLTNSQFRQIWGYNLSCRGDSSSVWCFFALKKYVIISVVRKKEGCGELWFDRECEKEEGCVYRNMHKSENNHEMRKIQCKQHITIWKGQLQAIMFFKILIWQYHITFECAQKYTQCVNVNCYSVQTRLCCHYRAQLVLSLTCKPGLNKTLLSFTYCSFLHYVAFLTSCVIIYLCSGDILYH